MSDRPAIDVHSLRYSYAGGPPALSDINLRVADGEVIGLVGPNGAGKTTLFLCLAGVLRTTAGSVRIGGLDPGIAADRRRLPEQVGIVFQHSDDQLFSATVLDDVAFGPLNLGLSTEEARQRVTQALERVGLAGFEQRVPFHLSGGEKRRVALASVLAMQPSILLLDEPSQYLDPRGRRELIHLLQGLPGTKIIASHDLELILDLCGRVVVLDHGQVMAEGASREVLANENLMETHGLEVPYRLR